MSGADTPEGGVEVAIVTGVSGAGRSTAAKVLEDLGWFVVDYLPPALGCALANYLGNNGHPVLAVLVILTIPVYVWMVLKPQRR